MDLPPETVEAPPAVLQRYQGDELPALTEAVTTSIDHLKPWMPWARADPLGQALEEFHCDEANVASACVPRRLGFVLLGTVDKEVSAPGDIGRSMEWAMSSRQWTEAGEAQPFRDHRG